MLVLQHPPHTPRDQQVFSCQQKAVATVRPRPILIDFEDSGRDPEPAEAQAKWHEGLQTADHHVHYLQ